MSGQKVQAKIYFIRDQSVMLDFDLAEMYEVETRVLNQAVKRNSKRFPKDFMFQLTKSEWETLISQCVTSKGEKQPLIKNRIKSMSSQFVMTSASKRPKSALPFAFTEQGLAMLSGILNSEKAINVNISIMRAFVVLRQFALTNDNLTTKLKEIETKYDKQFKDVYEAINFLMQKEQQIESQQKRKIIGFKK
jgi:hypothetical protein